MYEQYFDSVVISVNRIIKEGRGGRRVGRGEEGGREKGGEEQRRGRAEEREE